MTSNLPQAVQHLTADPATGALPVVKCDGKWGCLQPCITTRHRCTYPDTNGGFILDNKRICGAAFCMVCNEHNDSETSQFCPAHNPDSLMGFVFTQSSSPITLPLPSTTIQTTNPVDAEPIANACSNFQQNASSPVTTADVPDSLEHLFRQASIDTSMFINDQDFFDCLNEQPTPYTSKNVRPGWYRVPNTKTMLKQVKAVAKGMLAVYHTKPEFMSIPHSNKSATENILCKYIYEHSIANSRFRREINSYSHPAIWELVKDLPLDRKVNILDQSTVLLFALSRWGKTMEAAMKNPHRNDYCRYIGILLHPDNRDLLDALQKTRPIEKGDRRAAMDDPKYKPKHIYENLHQQFINEKVKVALPTEWKQADKINGYRIIDPNDITRMRLAWTPEDMKSLDAVLRTFYKQVMYKWAYGTGGGGGSDEGYGEWMNRCPIKYWDKRTKVIGAPFYMIFVYMKDKESNFVFETSYEGLQDNATAEGGISGTSSLTLTPKGKGGASRGGNIDKYGDAISKSIALAVEAINTMAGPNKEQTETGIETEKMETEAKLCYDRGALLNDMKEVNSQLAAVKRKHDHYKNIGKKPKKIKKYRDEVRSYENTKKSIFKNIKAINDRLSKTGKSHSDGEQVSSDSGSSDSEIGSDND